MSQGNKIVPVRFNAELLKAMDDALWSRNFHCPGVPDTLSDWIRKAVEMRLQHLKRSKKNNRCETPGRPPEHQNMLD